jgi:MoxR-like ATPase
VLGVAGTIYATNEGVRKRLPRNARDLPDHVRHRFESAVSAAREASSRRREEILRDLERHDAAHSSRAPRPETVKAETEDLAETGSDAHEPEAATQTSEEEPR